MLGDAGHLFVTSIGIPACCIKPDNRSGRASFPFRETSERIA
jgi:hypothetical protein